VAFLEIAQTGTIKAWKTSNSYAEAERAIGRYLAALALSDKSVLEELRDPVWSRRKLNGGGDTLHLADRAFPAESAKEPIDWADGVWLTSLQIFRDSVAVARLDDWDNDKAAIMLLFIVEGKWRIASEFCVTAARGTNAATMQVDTTEQKILSTLASFFDAVEQGATSILHDLSDENWCAKQHSPMHQVMTEDMNSFVARIAKVSQRLRRDNCKVADVQILYNRLACVRVDTPHLAETAIFLLCRRGQDWVIAEKASSGEIADYQGRHRLAM
jgi:L-fucose mutarotase/ribose pyranase (RbsD/FucU family)